MTCDDAGDANKQDLLKGCTPLHYAAVNGFSEVLRCLLDHGGLYDVKDNLGQTSLDVASDYSCQKVLRKQRKTECAM